MTDRDKLKLRAIGLFCALGITSAEKALSLWVIASKIDEVGSKVSIRFLARVLEVLRVEGYLETAQVRDDPEVFWLAKASALSDLRLHLGVRDVVGEAHLHDEMQLPVQDFLTNFLDLVDDEDDL